MVPIMAKSRGVQLLERKLVTTGVSCEFTQRRAGSGSCRLILADKPKSDRGPGLPDRFFGHPSDRLPRLREVLAYHYGGCGRSVLQTPASDWQESVCAWNRR